MTPDEVKTLRDFERFLKNAGFPGRAAARLASGGWPGLNPSDKPAADAGEIEALLSSIRSATGALKDFTK